MTNETSRQFRPGDLDRAFGLDGFAIIRHPTSGETLRVAAIGIDKSERILASGYLGIDTYVARLSPDGTLDDAFGDRGFCHLPNEAQASVLPVEIVVADDGSMIVVGAIYAYLDGPYRYYVPAASRVLEDGTLDTLFGNGGLAVYRPPLSRGKYKYRRVRQISPGTDGSAVGHGVLARQDDGSVFFAMDIFLFNGSMIYITSYVIKFHSDGRLDPLFGEKGFVEILDLLGNSMHGIDVDSQNRVIVAGQVNDAGTVARFLPNGKPDMTFGNEGRYQILDTARVRCFDVLALADDRLLVAVGTLELFPSSPSRFKSGVLGLTANGQPDHDFNEGQIRFVEERDFFGHGLNRDDLGRPLLSGEIEYYDVPFGWEEFAVTRYNSDGTIDLNFGMAGTARFEELFGIRHAKLQNNSERKRVNLVCLTQTTANEPENVICRILG